jgi:hypothetical protein
MEWPTCSGFEILFACPIPSHAGDRDWRFYSETSRFAILVVCEYAHVRFPRVGLKDQAGGVRLETRGLTFEHENKNFVLGYSYMRWLRLLHFPRQNREF